MARPKLEQPLIRRQLQTELAHGRLSQTALAEKYGCSQPSISDFARRHAAVIQEIREDAANEFAGLAIADKAKRLEAYADILEEALRPKPKGTASGRVIIDPETMKPVTEIDAANAIRALRDVAEELGDLPQRLQLAGDIGVKTNYTIAGVNTENLK